MIRPIEQHPVFVKERPFLATCSDKLFELAKKIMTIFMDVLKMLSSFFFPQKEVLEEGYDNLTEYSAPWAGSRNTTLKKGDLNPLGPDASMVSMPSCIYRMDVSPENNDASMVSIPSCIKRVDVFLDNQSDTDSIRDSDGEYSPSIIELSGPDPQLTNSTKSAP